MCVRMTAYVSSDWSMYVPIGGQRPISCNYPFDLGLSFGNFVQPGTARTLSIFKSAAARVASNHNRKSRMVKL